MPDKMPSIARHWEMVQVESRMFIAECWSLPTYRKVIPEMCPRGIFCRYRGPLRRLNIWTWSRPAPMMCMGFSEMNRRSSYWPGRIKMRSCGPAFFSAALGRGYNVESDWSTMRVSPPKGLGGTSWTWLWGTEESDPEEERLAMVLWNHSWLYA